MAASSADATAPPGLGYRWTICALLFLALTSNCLDRQVLGILAPTLQRELGWTETDDGSIGSWFSLSYAVGLLLAGRVMDRIGVRTGLAGAVGFAWLNYMTPLGLHHLMAEGHHYGPGPWVTGLSRADWTSTYYHRADTMAPGFDRTATGSNAVAQCAAPVRDRFASRATVPDEYFLWFHRVAWTDRMRSGRTLWDELVVRYSAGLDSARAMKRAWEGLAGKIDGSRHREIDGFLAIQAREAKWWRDASLAYFQTFSRLPFPAGYDRPAHPLEYYQRPRCPVDRTRPRCDGV